MIVAVHQPNYLPYLGFFHKMSLADVLILYDTAQFSKNEFHNRNQVKTPKGRRWLTIPVRDPGFRPIREVEIGDPGWTKRHWRTIQANYARAPSFDVFAERLDNLYRQTWNHLLPVNEAFLSFLANELGIRTRTIRASDLKPGEAQNPSARLADLVRRAGGDAYLSGPGGRGYLDPSAFEGLALLIQDFRHPEYRQQWGPFVPNLSAIDALLNAGETAGRLIESAGKAAPWHA